MANKKYEMLIDLSNGTQQKVPFEIPEGPQGPSGVYTGSVEPTDDSDVWIDPDGEMSDFRGPSAYEVAVENGFEGTEEEWLASLHGENYVLTEEDKNEIADIIMRQFINVAEVGA